MLPATIHCEVHTCMNCQMRNVHLDPSTYEWVCHQCGVAQGIELVNAWRTLSRTEPGRKTYCRFQYIKSLWHPLRYKNETHISEDPFVFGPIAQRIQKGKVTWKELKSMLEHEPCTRNKRIYALPIYLGFEVELNEGWLDKMKECHIIVRRKYPHFKFNNLYLLYRVVQLDHYYTDWIPISLSAGKIKEMDQYWSYVCEVCNIPFEPLSVPEYVNV
jgi:hypothetical protein